MCSFSTELLTQVAVCAHTLRYVKFDTFHPAVNMGLPVTRVINRVTLQQILSDAVIK